MAIEWTQEFEDGQTRAVCSKCGVPYRWPSQLVKQNDGFFYCPRCLEQTVLTRDRIQAQSRKRREAPPPKFVQAPNYAEDYLNGEMVLFKQITTSAQLSTDPNEIGWCVNYLADIMIQGKRPTRWDDRARKVIVLCCDRLLALQYGSPTGPAPTLSVGDVRYGGFSNGTILSTFVTSICGVALAKAYRTIGTPLYLDAASRCAHFVRHMQCQDVANGAQRVTWEGAPYHSGGLAQGVTADSTVVWTSRYNLYDAIGGWFLAVLGAIQGTATVYGSATSSSFTASTQATITTMLAELSAFLLVGARDVNYSGTLTTGLSVSYPRAVYLPQPFGAGTWGLTPTYGTPSNVLRGQDVACALFALNYMGQGTDRVNEVYDWLMTFTPNPANLAVPEDPELLIGTLAGTYSPALAIATELDVLADDGVTVLRTEHEGAAYDWMATALLAPIASVRRPVDFKATKDTLSVPQPSTRATPDPHYRWIGESGFSGLSLQIVRTQ